MTTNGTSAPLQARVEGGGTPEMSDWYLRSETGVLRDVLLGPAESFRWLGLENAAWSSLVRDTLRRGLRFDKQLAMRQHREMVDAYEQAGVTCHYLPIDENVPYQVYARDSSFMSPYGAVICQLANPRRRGEYAAVLRFYLEHGIPVYDMVSAGNFEGGDFNIIRHGTALVGYTDHRSERSRGRTGGGLVPERGLGDQARAHRPVLRAHRPHGLHAERALRRGVPGHHPGRHRRVAPKAKGIEIVPATFKETMALGCNVVALGQDRVLSTLGASDLNANMRAAGFTVYDPDMTMYTWAGGGVHCMCQPLRREAA